MHIQLKSAFVAAVVGVTAISGCQGIGQYIPSFGKTDPLASARGRNGVADMTSTPVPEMSTKNYAQVQLTMGDSMAKEGNFQAAQAAYEAAIRNDDKLARAYHRLALVQEKSGNGDASEKTFLRAIELDPKNAEIICDYGYWCYLRGDYKSAQKQFQKALKLNPNLNRAHNNLGLVFARTQRPEDALQQFALAGLSPADARANLGFVYLSEQRLPEARAELERAVAQTPTSAKAREVLASMQNAERDSEPKNEPVASPAAPPAEQQASRDVPPVVQAKAQPTPTPAPIASAPTQPVAPKTPAIAEVKTVQPTVATTPAPATVQQVSRTVPPVASPMIRTLPTPAAPQTSSPVVASAPRPAAPRMLPAPSAPPVAPRIAMVDKPVTEPSVERYTTQPSARQHVPVLSDYTVGSTVEKPAPKVSLTQFAEQRQVSSVVIGPRQPATRAEAAVPAQNSAPTIRFLPQTN